MTDVVVENVIAAAQSRVAKAEMRWGSADPRLLTELKTLAALHVLVNNHEQAKKRYWEIINIQHRLYGPLHWSNAESLLCLGELCFSEKDYANAEQFFIAALWILDQNPDSQTDLLSRVLLRLHGVYSLSLERAKLNSVLKMEALKWRAAYSSFSAAEMAKAKVKPIHGFSLKQDVA
jgi:tetratricopeptide (TPR) repeat protein